MFLFFTSVCKNSHRKCEKNFFSAGAASAPGVANFKFTGGGCYCRISLCECAFCNSPILPSSSSSSGAPLTRKRVQRTQWRRVEEDVDDDDDYRATAAIFVRTTEQLSIAEWILQMKGKRKREGETDWLSPSFFLLRSDRVLRERERGRARLGCFDSFGDCLPSLLYSFAVGIVCNCYFGCCFCCFCFCYCYCYSPTQLGPAVCLCL